jgi:predicted Zn finger-like uncharacterized protein
MIVTCPKCQKKYRIDQDQFHERIKFLRCQSCGQTFRFELGPRETEPTESGLLKLTCPGCHKQYQIDKSLLTQDMTSIPCKTCGLLVHIDTETITESDEKTSDDQKDIVQPEILSWSALSDGQAQLPQKRKKTIIFGAAAGILFLIIIAAYLFFILFFKKEDVQPKLGQTPSKILKGLPETDPQPLIYLDVNLDLLGETIKNRMPAENKDFSYQIATAIYDSLNPERGSLILYPDREYQFLPILIVQSRGSAGLKDALIKKGILNQFFEPSTGGTYRIKNEAVTTAVESDFPIDIYRVWLFEKSALFGPMTLSHIWAGGEKALLSSRIAHFANLVKKPGSLAVISLRTGDIREGWEKIITNPLAQDSDPQVAMISGMAASILSNLTKPFMQINTLAIGFRFSGAKERILSYAQEFRKDVNGARIYKQLKTGTWEDPDTEGLVTNLVKLLKDERLENNISFEKNRLSIDLTWSEDDDESILQTLTEATVGFLFARSMSNGKPTAGTVETQYAAAPELVPPVNDEKIKRRQISGSVKRSLFPGHFWNFGDTPRMDLELDPIDLPNASLAKLSYEILSIGLPGGKNVLRSEDTLVKQAKGAFIPLPVLKGTTKDELGQAKIRFHVSFPVNLKIFEFASGAEKGSVKEEGVMSVTLNQLEKDIASVACSGAKSCHLFAFDKTGQALANLESMGSSSSKFVRFKGIIATLKVAVVTDVLKHSFELEVDLNNGKELKLPAKPYGSVPVRYERHTPPAYADLSMQDLQSLKIKWTEDNHLSLTIPKSPFKGKAQWEAHFFHQNKPALLAWDPVSMGDKFVLYFREPLTSQPDAAFGKIRLELSTAIQRLTFSKKTSNDRMMKRLASGQKVVVTFDKNQITYNTGKSEVLQIAAYDVNGRRLKKGKISGNSKLRYTHRFWGQPTKFIMDVATQKIVKIIPFDFRKSTVNHASYKTYKQEIKHKREVVSALMVVNRARKDHYATNSDTLAGLYYINRKEQEPMKLIDRTLAHSDPVGKSRFGYRLKPYRGYFISYLSGTEEKGIKTDYPRQSKAKTINWQKGSFKTRPFYQRPDLVANPLDKSQPTFILVWDDVYMKYLNGTKLEYVPKNIFNSDWIKIRFVSG